MKKLLEQRSSLVADVLLATVAVIWGMGFPLTQMAIDANVGAGLIVAIRFSIAAVVIGILFWKEIRTLTVDEVKSGIIAGTVVAVAFLLQVVGQGFTTPSNSAFLSSTNVVIVPILGWIIFKQRPSRRLVLVSIGCVIGAAVLTISPTEGFVFNIGDILTVMCAVVFSFHITYLGSIAGRISAEKLTFLQTLTAALIGVLYTVIFEGGSLAKADFVAGMPAIIFLGLFSTAFAFFAQTFAQRHTAPTKAAIILGTEGLLGSVFSVLLGYEALTSSLIAGGSLIFVSLLAMELRPISLLKKRG